jgi:hypothetical protein
MVWKKETIKASFSLRRKKTNVIFHRTDQPAGIKNLRRGRN